MAKQLNVNLAVKANTQQAKTALEELNRSLSNILETKSITINDTSINNAKQAAIDLKKHLDAAVDVNTGKLDLSKFSSSLTKAGQSLQTLHANLSKIGPEGQSAFLALSKSIASADASALTLGSRLGGLLTTLKNTARWQISSSILHGFMGALQGAYGYAQDLNESLNNIRIVTGQSTDQMAKFAEQANRAAKQLSTTTTSYTDAALIYYQQGLSGKAVTDRVNTTIKLANVSRQSAEEVSSQMTAIWNNFADGSKQLEYYADVITKLGASTAASSSEISEGLQKFAAVADTVGLSYEKASAALATVVAETRQSADVIGTAFKTMFARFQGLELGETLEDGVTLNKYSEALSKVGVQILDANGHLKDMDSILDAVGEKWNTIGKEQQVALAETVAGTRQYAQFMAIMNNYDKILANQDLATGAEGALQAQADIYAESWEAARDRVRAALEQVYDQLINDKFFIGLFNGAEKAVEAISDVIDGLGGLKGILLLIGSIVLNKYAKEMPAFFEKITQNIAILTGRAEQNRQSMLAQNLQIINSMKGTSSSQEVSAQIDTMSKVSNMTLKLAQNRQRLSQAEIENYENKIKEVQIYGEVAAAIGKEVDLLNKEKQAQRNIVRNSMQNASTYGGLGALANADGVQEAVNTYLSSTNEQYNKLQEARKKVQDWINKAGPNSNTLPQLKQQLADIDRQLNNIKGKVTGRDLLQGLEQSAAELGKAENILSKIGDKTKIWSDQVEQLGKGNIKVEDIIQDMEKYINIAEQAGLDTKNLKDTLDLFGQKKIPIQEVVDVFKEFESTDLSALRGKVEQFQEAIVALGGNTQALEVYIAKIKEGASAEQALAAAKDFLNQKTDESITKTLQYSEALGKLAGAATQVVIIINAFKNIGSIINNDDLTDGEKMLQIATSATMILPTLINLFNLEKLANLSAAAARLFGIKAITAENAAHLASIPIKTAAGEAGWIALGPLLLFVGIAAGAIALIYAIAKAIETPAEKAKKAKKAAEELNQAYEDTKQAADSLKSTMDSYDSVVKRLKECTEGTKEWHDALQDVQQATRDIMQQYPDLVKDMVIEYEHGIPIIKNLADIQEKIQEKARTQQYEAILANANATAAQNDLDIDKARKKVQAKVSSYKASDDAAMNATGDQLLNTASVIFDQLANRTTEGIDDLLNSSGLFGEELENLRSVVADLVNNIEEENRQIETAYEFIANDTINSFAKTNSRYLKDYGNNKFNDAIIQAQSKELARYIEKNGGDAQAGLGEYNFRRKTAFDNEVSRYLSQFSDENRDTLMSILSGDLQGIDIENLKKLKLTGNEEAAFASLYNLLNATDDFNAEKVQNYISSQFSLDKIYRGQIKDVNSLREAMANYNKELQGLSFGDIIEPQLFNTLSEQAKTYFSIMEDGTYKLTGSAEQLQDILFKEATAGFDKNLELYDELPNYIEESLSDDEKFATAQARIGGLIDAKSVMVSNGQGGYNISNETEQIEANAVAYATAAKSLEQLEYVKTRFSEHNVDFSIQVKAEHNALQNLASKYESCTDELKDFQHALTIGNKDLIDAAKKTLEYSIRVGELAEKHGLDAKQTEAYAKRLKNHLGPAMKEVGLSEDQIEKAALSAAVANQRLDRGIASLNSNLESYREKLVGAEGDLTGVNKNTFEWSNTMDDLKTDLADILNMDESVLSDDFAESMFTNATNAENLKKALEGDATAIIALRTAAADQMIIDIQTNLEEAGEHIEGFQGDWERLKALMAETIETGDVDQSKVINAFNDLIEKGHLTKEQIEAALAGLNVAADLEVVYNKGKVLVPNYVTYETIEELPNPYGTSPIYKKTTHTVPSDPVEVEGSIPTYKVKGTTSGGSTSTRTVNLPAANLGPGGVPNPTALMEDVASGLSESQIQEKYTTPRTVTVTPKTGFVGLTTDNYDFNNISEESYNDDDDKKGGGDKEHHYKEKLLKEEQHRYEDIRNELASLQKSYERVAKAEELLYGKEKFDSMRKRLKMLEDEEKIARKLLEANLGNNWEYYYNKVKNGEAITKDDIANAGGYLGGDWDELTGQKGIAIQYQQTENGNEINKSENINIGAIFEAAGIKWDPKIIDGFFENPEKIEDNITKLEQKLYAGIDRTQEGYEEKEARIAAIIQAIRDVYASTTTELQNMNEMIDENIEYEHKRQAIIDAFPKKHLELITDELHRYDELNKTLEELNRQYEDLGKARERAWGKNKIQLLDQELKKLEQLQGTYEEYLETIFGENWKDVVKALQSGSSVGSLLQSGIIGGTLSQDRQRLIGKQGNTFDYIFTDDQGHDQRYQEELDLEGLLGFAIEFDASGNITNLDKIMSRFDEIENERKTKYDNETGIFQGENQYEDQQEAEKEKRRIEVAKERLEQYQDTITAGIDNYEQWLDNQYEQQAKFYENFRYKIDLKIEISERSLKRIEYAIKVLGDNIYKVPEIMQSWFDKRVGETMGEVTSQAGTWAQAFTDAQAAYAAGDISQEDYVQTIKDAQDGLYGCIDALLEINEEMREYYKNVLSRVKEEMSRITNEMDHQLDTVQHLTNVLSLLGRDTDYEAIGKILDAQLKMNENGYNVSKAQVEMYRDQVAKAEATLQELIMEGVSEDAQNEWKNAVLYPAKEALLEAEKEMQADFEAYLETVNAIYENKINQIYQDSERRLAGLYGSFDELNNAMERQRALDDEYLTKTNQIYETNVLIKKIAKDIDKTNNDSAKLKLKNFSAEIDGLQQKNKLSKSELDIAKARYEVLQAEIALEDARNAKSTVRLQRDNEGNYGYVYTADADNIAAAEDAVEGKRNDLYNLVLGQANNYTEKIIQLTQERNAALKQLDLDYAEGRIADEDTYNRLKEDIVNKYNSLIEEDYESYYRALYWLDETAVTDHTEAWGTGFQDILDAGEDFQSETDQLMQETGSAIDWLNEIRDRATEEAKVGNGELEQQLKDLTDQNDALAKKMQEEVIPQAGETLTKAQELTAEWARQYEEIMRLIDAYLALIDAMQKVLLEMSGLDENIEDEFDMTKDYSREATEAFKNSGNQVTLEVIQALLDRQTKEEKLGGHNENYFTNEQLLELFMKAQETKDEALLSFIEDILSNNATYTVDRLKELGISEAGYSLDAAKESVDFAAQAQDEANDLTKEAVQAQVDNKDATKDSAEQIENATEDNADKNETTATELAENTQQTAEELANTTQETEEALVNSEQELMDQEQDLMEDTTNEIEGTTENLISALDRNANIVSSAVQMAAQTMAYSIMQAKTAELNAENAARRAEAAAASISGATGLASGGYTGAWGSHGKIAILHEKELVLNATDTENLLSAISLLRDFSSAIDLRAAENSISGGLNSPYYGGNAQSLEQEVTIHAEFPGVTNHNEIEEAFNNLVNRASQYAHRY